MTRRLAPRGNTFDGHDWVAEMCIVWNFRTGNGQKDQGASENPIVQRRDWLWPRVACILLAVVVMALVGVVICTKARGAEILPGPIPAEVVRVVDGDTIEVLARIWPGHTVKVLVRLDGIDTPELRGRCEAEKAAAREARRVLGAWLPDKAVSLLSVHGGKFAGRMVARVRTSDGVDHSEAMVIYEVARPCACAHARATRGESTTFLVFRR